MAISATVNISGSFLDSDESGAITSFKKSHLASAETLTGGKVIVVTGTTDETGITINPENTGFRNAAGEEVSLTAVSRVFATGEPGVTLRFGTGNVIINAIGGRLATTCCVGAGDRNVNVRATSGTSSYSVLLWQAD